jgi:hypothetical protein
VKKNGTLVEKHHSGTGWDVVEYRDGLVVHRVGAFASRDIARTRQASLKAERAAALGSQGTSP